MIGLPTLLKIWHGIFFTTISRSSLTDHGTPTSIVEQVWSYGGWTIIAAVAAGVAVAAVASTIAGRLLAAALVASALVVPLYQSFDAQTGWALDKHMTCGIWLGAMVIGGGLSQASWPTSARAWGSVAFSAAALFPIIVGWYSAYGVQLSWPNETGLAAAARSFLPSGPETGYTNLAPPYLDYYTLPDSVDRLTWVSTIRLKPAGPPNGWLKYYRAELGRNKFGLIVLVFPGSLKSSLLPGAVFRALNSPSQQQLVQVASTSSSTPGLYYLKLALDADRDYRAVASGPYDSGFGYGTSPWTFVIYQRENHVQSSSADVAGL